MKLYTLEGRVPERPWRVLTAEEMRRADTAAAERLGLAVRILMELAGRSVAQLLERRYPMRPVWVLCGKGHNGGDGLVTARYLLEAGRRVHVILAVPPEELSGEPRAAWERLLEIGFSCRSRWSWSLWPDAGPVEPSMILVDALLGTGVKRPVEGALKHMIAWMNRSGRPVVAVDVPSGLSSDTGAEQGQAVRAWDTVAMACLKRGLLLDEGRHLSGRIWVADIGIPDALLAEVQTFAATGPWVAAHWPRRRPGAHKYQVGRLFVLAGSPGLTGAPVLAAQAAARIGAGAVVIGAPVSVAPLLAAKTQEVMTRALSETETGTLSMAALASARQELARSRAGLIGPGLGRHPQTTALVAQLLSEHRSLPIVVDADGLFALSERRELLDGSPKPWVLTPHAGEFARLAGVDPEQVRRARAELARHWARSWGVVLVLKGMPSVVGTPEGRLWINPTGDERLATAGSGDVLAGLIAGLLAQGLDPERAAVAALFVGGLAAEAGPRNLLAGDILANLEAGIP
ncbi:MAG: NAD(P)H-hydrate dehydratase [Bacteroidota bacterium]|nr:NAD(P)H-hydrate dehydratase [Bacteroidota bacterium]